MITNLSSILTQDNLATQHPVFVVYQKDLVATSSDHSNCDPVYINWDRDGIEMSAEEYESWVLEYEAWEERGKNEDEKPQYEGGDFEPSHWEEVHLFEYDKFCGAFFTRLAAEEYIRANAHNLRKPFVFVESAHRNREWQEIRQELINRAEKEKNSDISA